MTCVTKTGLEDVVNTMLRSARDELKSMSDPAELERFWFFKHDPKASLEWNAYQFNSMLDLYKSKCRQWEELHNGNCCVVERVRDKYLMPKIHEWVAIVKANS